MRPITAAIAAAIITGSIVGGAALAIDEPEVISACANNKTGSMRYLTSGSCKSSETALEWNVQGPAGGVAARIYEVTVQKESPALPSPLAAFSETTTVLTDDFEVRCETGDAAISANGSRDFESDNLLDAEPGSILYGALSVTSTVDSAGTPIGYRPREGALLLSSVISVGTDLETFVSTSRTLAEITVACLDRTP
jgi:hypothetical protein